MVAQLTKNISPENIWFKSILNRTSQDIGTIDEGRIKNKILNAIEGKYCEVIHDKYKSWESPTANSIVVSLPSMNLNKILPKNYKEFAMNMIYIKGKINETLHYHTSHIIGVVLSGKGILYRGFSTNFEEAEKIYVKVGDIIVIPKDSYHIFDCPDSELVTLAIELSNTPIDYQLHHK